MAAESALQIRPSTCGSSVERPKPRTAASYERELEKNRKTEQALRKALADDDHLLHEKDELIEQRELLSKESDHRLLNGMQMIASLLSLQSRASIDPEVASQLGIAANRVAMIERIHRRLHYLHGLETVDLRQYLGDLCRDLSMMLARDEQPWRDVAFDGIEAHVAAATAIPLGFIVNELVTNAAKYGKGQIKVKFESDAADRYALSVSNDGPELPERFDPAAVKGLGMQIIRALIGQVAGELRFARNVDGRGAQFTVLFPKHSGSQSRESSR